MRLALQISLCCLLAGSAMARSGGGVGGGGGFRGGGGGFRGGSVSFGAGRSVFSGAGGNFLHPTTAPGLSFRGGNFFGGRGFFDRGGRGFGRGFYGGYGYGSFYPYLGLGWDYMPSYYDSYYASPYYAYPPADYGGGYASYQPSPNVTVIYPQQTAAAEPPPERARPVTREYDQYGQEVRPGAAPVYLIAFNDHVIRAAVAYWIDGKTLHYVTLQREEKQAALDTVDAALSTQLNRERQVPFQLPPQ